MGQTARCCWILRGGADGTPWTAGVSPAGPSKTASRLDAGALWLGLRLERMAGNREAEANYGLQLRRYYPEAQETAWLLGGQYDMPGGRQ